MILYHDAPLSDDPIDLGNGLSMCVTLPPDLAAMVYAAQARGEAVNFSCTFRTRDAADRAEIEREWRLMQRAKGAARHQRRMRYHARLRRRRRMA